jgi:hypothetical protein
MKNLSFQNFFRQVIIPTTPEDQKDSVYFELEEWVNAGFNSIPSTEAQRVIDSLIPVWLSNFSNASDLVDSLRKISRKLEVRAGLEAIKYSIKKHNCGSKELNQYVALVEKWLIEEKSVSFELLLEAVASIAEFAYSRYNRANGAGYTLIAFVFLIDSIKNNTDIRQEIKYLLETSDDEEICEVILEKIPKICYENLLQSKNFFLIDFDCSFL